MDAAIAQYEGMDMTDDSMCTSTETIAKDLKAQSHHIEQSAAGLELLDEDILSTHAKTRTDHRPFLACMPDPGSRQKNPGEMGMVY